MKKITISIVLASLCLNFPTFAQLSPELNPVKPGENIPDLRLDKVSNYPRPSLQLADFKDKLLIIDFWATWCGTCVDALPKIEKLQKQFDGQVQILAVSNENSATIKKAFDRLEILKGVKPVHIAEEKQLQKLFPHQYLPHVVWIRNGVYLGATETEFLTAANIHNVLKQETFGLLQKSDIQRFDLAKPLFQVNGDPQTRGLKTRMTANLSGYLPGLPAKAGYQTDSLNGQRRYYVINHTLLHLYTLTLESPLAITANRRILEVKDPNDYLIEKSKDFYHLWALDHAYCFEMTAPLNTSPASFRKQLKSTLDNTFDLNARIEEREVDCLLLQVTDSSKLVSKYEKRAISWKPGLPVRSMKHATAAELCYQINASSPLPVINETRTQRTFDISTSTDPRTAAEWQEVLKDSGYTLVPAKRKMAMFVLTEKDHPNLSRTNSSDNP